MKEQHQIWILIGFSQLFFSSIVYVLLKSNPLNRFSLQGYLFLSGYLGFALMVVFYGLMEMVIPTIATKEDT